MGYDYSVVITHPNGMWPKEHMFSTLDEAVAFMERMQKQYPKSKVTLTNIR